MGIILIIILFSIIFFGLLFFLLKFLKIGSDKFQRYFSLLVSILFPFIFSYFYFNVISNRNYSFESKDWKEKTHLRYMMYKDIKNRKLLIGKKLNEITNLLGDDYKKCPDYLNSSKKGNSCITFKLNDGSDWGLDHSVLLIRFENNIVVQISKESI